MLVTIKEKKNIPFAAAVVVVAVIIVNKNFFSFLRSVTTTELKEIFFYSF